MRREELSHNKGAGKPIFKKKLDFRDLLGTEVKI
jgi:hypothetical protein